MNHAYWIGLIPALPLLAASWIGLTWLFGLNRGEAGEKHTARVAQGATLLALLLILTVDVLAWRGSLPENLVLGSWLHSGAIQIDFSLQLDRLSLMVGTLVLLIAWLTQRFSANYMHREAGFQRFYLVLCLFTAAMTLIVLAGNAVFMFIGWELAGVSSYLLIAYAYERPTATRNATRAFITNRIGDAGFIFGLFLSLHYLGSSEWSVLHSAASGEDVLLLAAIAGSFLLAALVKSAAVPFAPWLARALEGPTPSSAIFYGALMVHAGIYLILRLEPLLQTLPAVQGLLLVVGVLTAGYGLLSALVQSDVKSALIFSTTAQIGLMLMACGLGWYELATWHLLAHAVWRSYQFLSAPSLMHQMPGPVRRVPRWLRGRRRLYAACQQRFWLDSAADNLLVEPTLYLAREVQSFDERVVNPLVGLPGQADAISSLAQWEYHRGLGGRVEPVNISQGQGLLGRLMSWLSDVLYWFEEQLVLKGGGGRLLQVLTRLGNYLLQIEVLLSKPRYLWLMIMATLVVIIGI